MKTVSVRAALFTVLLASLIGCAPIKSYEVLKQPAGQVLETYVGGSILKIDRATDLPNSFGKADVYGGKIYGGFTEVRFQGVSDEGKLLLRVTEFATTSNETALNRYDRRVPQGSTTILPANSTDIAIDTKQQKEIVIAGVRVTFLEVEPTRLRYTLQRLR